MRCSDMPTWQVFGAWLKSQRTSQGWGLRDFARAIHIDPGNLCHIEAGTQPPPSDAFLMRMAEMLDIPSHTLVAMAGRLPREVWSRFVAHPGTPPILSAFGGMSLPDAQTFCQQVSTRLPVA